MDLAIAVSRENGQSSAPGKGWVKVKQGGQMVGQAYKELTQFYPKAGWVEHDPLEIWHDTKTVMEAVVKQTGIDPQTIAALGLTVQRETCLLWDKTTGQPLHPAIVWQDRRAKNWAESDAD